MAAIKRTFTKTLKQAEGKGFDKIGDAYEGTFAGVKHVSLTEANGQKRDASLIMLSPDEGEPFGVWANAVLLDLISQVEPGAYVKIVHHALGPKKGKNSPTKLFQVQIAD
jgi:hypothetical protein